MSRVQIPNFSPYGGVHGLNGDGHRSRKLTVLSGLRNMTFCYRGFFLTSIATFAAVFMAAAFFAPANAKDFDFTQCPLAQGQRVFVYQDEKTYDVLGCIRVDVRTCEVNLRKGSWNEKFEQKYVDACRKTKEIGT